MKSLRTIWIFAWIDILRSFRDKVALFFIFVFPLIFLFVFGGIFGNSGDTYFNVALINQSDSKFAADFVSDSKKEKVLKVSEDVTTIESAREKMKRGELDATIILPESFGELKEGQTFPSGEAEVLYDKNSEQAGQTLMAILGAVFKEINSGITQAPEPFTVRANSTAEPGLKSFDYVFAGLLGFSILSLGIFGPTSVFPRMKQQGILRRYHTTTLRVWQYFLANVISTAVIGILSVALMFIVAILFFDLQMRGDYITLLIVVVLGTLTLFGVGLAIGGWAKNENQAAPLANLITFPMMFLSGTFFPRFLMPEWLQSASALLPLTPVIDGIRFVITEGKTLLDLGPQLGLIAIWIVVIYAIAFKVFRWE